MKIGIMTFHWATNYGAILQAYALQEALKSIGHEVAIIDYKPSRYDDTLWSFIRFRKFLDLRKYLNERRKEARLSVFRKRYLKLTNRFYTQNKLSIIGNNFDALVSGSDQVMNESFLVNGERGGSTAYFLDFGSKNTLRFAYAASFGTTNYSDDLIKRVRPLIEVFDDVSSREESGLSIFEKMGANNASLVPDPTLLQSKDFYARLLKSEEKLENRNRAYFLRGRDCVVADALGKLNAELLIDISLEQWLNSIRYSSHFITNSFHGVVFCLIFHTPFTVVLDTKENIGMNDRFYTLLKPLSLTDRIFSEAEFNSASTECSFDWNSIDNKMEGLRKIGFDYLKQIK